MNLTLTLTLALTLELTLALALALTLTLNLTPTLALLSPNSRRGAGLRGAVPRRAQRQPLARALRPGLVTRGGAGPWRAEPRGGGRR